MKIQTKTKTIALLTFSLLCLSGCQAESQVNDNAARAEAINSDSAQTAVQLSDKLANVQDETGRVEIAQEIIQVAFDVDVKDKAPQVDRVSELQSFTFTLDTATNDIPDTAVVEYRDNVLYPERVYYYHNPNNEEQVDISTDENFVFDTTFISTAKDFVAKVYGVDCSKAAYRAYGYQNKIAVQFHCADDTYFDVRFHYQDSTQPVGIMYYQMDEQADMFIKKFNAKIYAQSENSTAEPSM